MYGYGWPVCGCQGNNDGSNSSWLWIVIIVFVVFFLIWGNNSNSGQRNQGCC